MSGQRAERLGIVNGIPRGGTAGQVLTKGSDGDFDHAWAAGGGAAAGVGDLRIVSTGNNITIPAAPTAVDFTSSTDPDPVGDSIDWAIGTPDTVTITADGIYVVHWSAVLTVAAGAPEGNDAVQFGCYPEYNGDNAGPFYYLSAGVFRSALGDATSTAGFGPVGSVTFPLSEGDEFRLLRWGDDGAAGVSARHIQATMLVTRIG